MCIGAKKVESAGTGEGTFFDLKLMVLPISLQVHDCFLYLAKERKKGIIPNERED